MTALATTNIPAIERRVEAYEGAVFWFGGRPIKVMRVAGYDDAAPVIVEELVGDGADILPGQYGLWPLRGVRRAMGAKR